MALPSEQVPAWMHRFAEWRAFLNRLDRGDPIEIHEDVRRWVEHGREGDPFRMLGELVTKVGGSIVYVAD